MAHKLDEYRSEILNRSRSDKEIAQEAGVTMGAVRVYRNRNKLNRALDPGSVYEAPDPAKEETAPDVSKKCPKCGVEATGEEQVQELFGFRNVPAGKSGGKKRIPQSQCRVCRGLSAKRKKAQVEE